jgi:hypothetical protein
LTGGLLSMAASTGAASDTPSGVVTKRRRSVPSRPISSARSRCPVSRNASKSTTHCNADRSLAKLWHTTRQPRSTIGSSAGAATGAGVATGAGRGAGCACGACCARAGTAARDMAPSRARRTGKAVRPNSGKRALLEAGWRANAPRMMRRLSGEEGKGIFTQSARAPRGSGISAALAPASSGIVPPRGSVQPGSPRSRTVVSCHAAPPGLIAA